MPNDLDVVIVREDDWFVACCPEVPGANGQGRTPEAARANLEAAITLILEDRALDSGC